MDSEWWRYISDCGRDISDAFAMVRFYMIIMTMIIGIYKYDYCYC